MENLKRERIDFTTDQVEKLEQEWRNGLKSTKFTEKIQELSMELDISTCRIKKWIGNRNRKEAPSGKKYIKSKTYSKGPSGYSVFASTCQRGNLNGKEYLKDIGSKWKQLKTEEKQAFQEKAKAQRENPMRGLSRTDIIHQQLKKIKDAVGILENVGYAIGGFGLDPQTEESKHSLRFVTTNSDVFFTTTLFERFEKMFNTTDRKIKETDKKDALIKRLRKHFQECWVKSTGLNKAVPYKTIAAKEKITVSGLPDGVIFKDPGTYGRKTINLLLKVPITFEMLSNTANKGQEIRRKLSEVNINDKVTKQADTEDLLSLIGGNEVGCEEESLEEERSQDIDDLIEQVSKQALEPTIREIAPAKKRKAAKRQGFSVRRKKKKIDDKYYAVDKILKREGGNILLLWSDGSTSWEPESSLIIN